MFGVAALVARLFLVRRANLGNPTRALRRRIANLTAIMKQSFISKGVPEAWERENE